MWSPLKSLRRLFTSKPIAKFAGRTIRARYDATRVGHENANHWADSDALGPNNANNATVRNELARRVRLERENNPHMFGMQKTAAYAFVGTGPRLQLTLSADLYESTRKFEQVVASWMRATGFAEKLHLMIGCCPFDGETFGQIIENPAVEHRIKLDVRVMEQEQVATPGFSSWESNALNGLVMDKIGNVVAYHVLNEHPGDATTYQQDYTVVPAKFMLHWFRPYRPSQARGVSEFASSIETCAQTRRYAKATLSKQELNANIAGVIESENLSVDGSDTPTFETMEEIDIPRAGLMTMPNGMKAKPFESAQNTTGYGEYMEMNYSTMGRPIGLPRNLVTNDSSGFNFASGRMDHLPFQGATWVDRDRCRTRILDKLLKALYAVAKESNLVPANLPPMSEWTWDWHWDGFPSIDQVKDEKAREMRLKNGISTLSEECAADGKDWREVALQLETEVKYYQARGLIHPYSVAMAAAMPAPPANASGSQPPEEIEDEDDTTLERANARYARV